MYIKTTTKLYRRKKSTQSIEQLSNSASNLTDQSLSSQRKLNDFSQQTSKSTKRASMNNQRRSAETTHLPKIKVKPNYISLSKLSKTNVKFFMANQ